MKTYAVITRKAQVWDEITVFDADSKEHAIEQAKDCEEFHHAIMQSESVAFRMIANDDEWPEHLAYMRGEE